MTKEDKIKIYQDYPLEDQLIDLILRPKLSVDFIRSVVAPVILRQEISMTIEQFKESKRYTECIGSEIGDESWIGESGWIYSDSLFIADDGEPVLHLEGDEIRGNLDYLESTLFYWAYNMHEVTK